MDRNRPGERAFIAGSSSFLYNVFTGNPQFQGGHIQFATNRFIPGAVYQIQSGTDAGSRGTEISVEWLKAFGTRAIAVSGRRARIPTKPSPTPASSTVFCRCSGARATTPSMKCPAGRPSLAHVIPAAAVVKRTPIHGLDIEPVKPYVAALEDSRYPLATFQWKGMSEAEIRATVERGQVVAVQVTYDPGWEAYANGKRQPIRPDAIGLMAIEPACDGPCEISLRLHRRHREHRYTRDEPGRRAGGVGLRLARRRSSSVALDALDRRAFLAAMSGATQPETRRKIA